MSKPKFLIIGNMNAVTYKEIFPLIKDNKIVFGHNIPTGFKQPDGTIAKIGALTKWFSNLVAYKQYKNIELIKKYYNKDGSINSDKFPTYDNYDAINIDRVSNIPKDYFGVMGVPITFLDKYNPEQFEIIGLDRYTIPKEDLVTGRAAINGKPCYARILIKRKIKHPKFLIIGNKNAISYKEIFPLFKDNKMWIGFNSPKEFMTPEGTKTAKLQGLTRWFSNMEPRNSSTLKLTKSYYEDTSLYPKYDNFNAININKTTDIPKDYYDIMGVPISFLDYYDPNQFEIKGITCRNYSPEYITKVYSKDDHENANDLNGSACLLINNNPETVYSRILIKRKTKHPKFLILGNMNAVICKEIFPLIKENKIWSGYTFNKTMEFIMPDDYQLKGKAFIDENGKKHGFVPGISWFSNLDISKRNEDLILYEKYYNKDGTTNSDKFPTYDNYDAIEVSKTHEIPKDYFGVMGVPITFLDKYNPEQFEIIWQASGNTKASTSKDILEEINYQSNENDRGGCGVINNKRVYSRILIKRKQ